MLLSTWAAFKIFSDLNCGFSSEGKPPWGNILLKKKKGGISGLENVDPANGMLDEAELAAGGRESL